jgi:hypothetical protein
MNTLLHLDHSSKALALLESELKRTDLTPEYKHWLKSNISWLDSIAYAFSEDFCKTIEDTILQKETLVNNVPKYLQKS